MVDQKTAARTRKNRPDLAPDGGNREQRPPRAAEPNGEQRAQERAEQQEEQAAEHERQPSLKELRRLLVRTETHPDHEVGGWGFVQRIWSQIPAGEEIGARERGRTMRAVVWDLIERHEAEARSGAMTCPICASLADAYHVVWWAKQYSEADGFSPRYSYKQLIALSAHRSPNGSAPQPPSGLGAALDGFEGAPGVPDSVEMYPILRKYSDDWYGDRMAEALAGLAAHLRPEDRMLRSAFAARGIELLPDNAQPECADWRAANAATSESATSESASVASPAAGWRMLVALRMCCLAAIIATLISLGVGSLTASADLPSVDLTAVGLSGFFLGVAIGDGIPHTLVAINAHTGEQRPFWPEEDQGSSGAPAAPSLAQFRWLQAPAYAPGSQQIAFIAVGEDGAHSIWTGGIAFTSDGWPQIAAPGPRELLAQCQPCNALSWSPSGAWLVYDGESGLAAVAASGGAIRQLTQEASDRWPACAPDGHALAYQDALDGITVLPAQDCLPSPGRAARYVDGYAPAWRAAWSANGRLLAFASKRGGATHTYLIRANQLSQTPLVGQAPPVVHVSPAHCEDPFSASASGPHAYGDLIVYVCSQPDVTQHDTLVAVPAVEQPSWRAVLDEATTAHYTLCWVPFALPQSAR